MGLKKYYNENNVEVLCSVVVNDNIVRTSPELLCPLTWDLTTTSDNIMTCQPSTAEDFRTYRILIFFFLRIKKNKMLGNNDMLIEEKKVIITV